jgi:hypothetical protein
MIWLALYLEMIGSCQKVLMDMERVRNCLPPSNWYTAFNVKNLIVWDIEWLYLNDGVR